MPINFIWDSTVQHAKSSSDLTALASLPAEQYCVFQPGERFPCFACEERVPGLASPDDSTIDGSIGFDMSGRGGHGNC
jgi:hypothetical protein